MISETDRRCHSLMLNISMFSISWHRVKNLDLCTRLCFSPVALIKVIYMKQHIKYTYLTKLGWNKMHLLFLGWSWSDSETKEVTVIFLCEQNGLNGHRLFFLLIPLSVVVMKQKKRWLVSGLVRSWFRLGLMLDFWGKTSAGNLCFYFCSYCIFSFWVC